MNCDQFSSLIGMRCERVGSDAIEVITPFTFSDGNGLEIFASSRGSQVYLFDDGLTLVHLQSAGLPVAGNKRRWQPLRNIAATYGVNLSDDGVFELLCPADNPAHGFARMVSALLGIAAWERDQAGVSIDSSWFVEEVALYLQAWKQSEKLLRKPSVRGFSGRTLTFDFALGDLLIDALLPHGITTGAELRKLVDFSSSSAKGEQEPMIILDDRTHPEQAKQEQDILSRLATVWPVSALIAATGSSGAIQ